MKRQNLNILKQLILCLGIIIICLTHHKTYALNLASAFIEDYIDIPEIAPEGLTWDGTNLWVTDSSYRQFKFTQISPITKTIIKTIPGFCDAEGLAWDGSYLWTFCITEGNLIKINPLSEMIEGSISVGELSRGGLTFDGNYLWKVVRPNFIKIDPSTGTVVETISEFDLPGIEEGLTYDGNFL